MNKEIIKYNIKENFPTIGVKFIDFMPTFTNYEIMEQITNDIASQIKDVECIVMPESRGFIIGSIVANKLKAQMIPIRKHGKLPNEFIGSTEEYDTEYSKTTIDIPKIDIKGKKCYFIDDVYATGGTYRATKKLIEKMGGEMIGGICIYSVGIDENKEIKCYLYKGDIK